MKHLLIAVTLALGSQFVIAEEPKKQTKQVCVDVKKDGKDVKDPKTGKTKQLCRQVKQHKKLEGAEAVPEGKKK
jgi:hypothetical protein